MTAPPDERFPELNNALLGTAELTTLFQDYRACAEIREIVVKSGPGYVATHSQPTLDDAEDLLRKRAVRGVQIRYQFEGDTWWDTLMTTPGGVRLVRIRQTLEEGM